MTDETHDDDGQDPDEAAAELFPNGALEGDALTRQGVFRKGLATELVVSLSRAEVPIRGKGLVNPDKYGRVLVTYLPGKLHELPIRQDEHDGARVTALKLTQDLRAMYVEDANDVAALIRSEFEALVAKDGAAATDLLAELRALATGIRAVA